MQPRLNKILLSAAPADGRTGIVAHDDTLPCAGVPLIAGYC